MIRPIAVLALCVFCYPGPAAPTARAEDLRSDIPRRNTPQKLQEAWLRYHESGLCQEVDSVFDFYVDRVEVRGSTESDSSELKFRKLFEPLRSLYRVELHMIRSGEAKQPEGANDPPPSLWQNYELRANIGDRSIRTMKPPLLDEDALLDPGLADSLIKQRLLIYAEQTMDRNRKMERYAQDLYALARVAFDPGTSPAVKPKAMNACLAHAKDLEKLIGKLTSSLSLAMPGSGKVTRPDAQIQFPETAGKTPLERALHISSVTQDIARRVHTFIYPEDYTVEVNELRNPSLIESLRILQRTVMDFQRMMSKTPAV